MDEHHDFGSQPRDADGQPGGHEHARAQGGHEQGDERPVPAGAEGTQYSRAQLPRTGDQQVDEALEHLADVHDLPPAEQVEVYVGVHRALQDRLADLEG